MPKSTKAWNAGDAGYGGGRGDVRKLDAARRARYPSKAELMQKEGGGHMATWHMGPCVFMFLCRNMLLASNSAATGNPTDSTALTLSDKRALVRVAVLRHHRVLEHLA